MDSVIQRSNNWGQAKCPLNRVCPFKTFPGVRLIEVSLYPYRNVCDKLGINRPTYGLKADVSE